MYITEKIERYLNMVNEAKEFDVVRTSDPIAQAVEYVFAVDAQEVFGRCTYTLDKYDYHSNYKGMFKNPNKIIDEIKNFTHIDSSTTAVDTGILKRFRCAAGFSLSVKETTYYVLFNEKDFKVYLVKSDT
jgi:hypothetical protein